MQLPPTTTTTGMSEYFLFDPQASDRTLHRVQGDPASSTLQVDHWEYWLFEPRMDMDMDMAARKGHAGRWGVLHGSTALDVEKQLKHAQDMETFSCAFYHTPVGAWDCTYFNPKGPIAVSAATAEADGSPSRSQRFTALRKSLTVATGLFARLNQVASDDKQRLSDDMLTPYTSALIALVQRVNRIQYMVDSFLDHELNSIEQAMQHMQDGPRLDLLTKLHALGFDIEQLTKLQTSESRGTSERLLSML